MLGHYFRGTAELQESLSSFVCKDCRMKGSALSPESRLWFFWGGDAREYPGGLLRLDPAFAYAEPPSS